MTKRGLEMWRGSVHSANAFLWVCGLWPVVRIEGWSEPGVSTSYE